MAVARNKLQDIYSSAVSRLAELEASQHSTLARMYKKYNDTDTGARADLNKNLSGRQELLAQEIQSFVSNSMSRIQSAIDMQCSLTNTCLNRCSQRLVLATHKFEEGLGRTRSRQDVLEMDSLDELSAQFSAFVEHSLMGFLQVQNEWSQRLRDKHATLRSNLEQAIASSVTNLRQNEHELTSTAQSAAMENSAKIQNEAEKLNEQLRAKYQEQSDSLVAKLSELDAAFQKHHNEVMLEAEAQARESSRGLTAHLETMYETPASELSSMIAKHKSALRKSFESGTSMLTGSLEKTRADIARSADERAGVIDAQAAEVHGRISSAVESLMQKLSAGLDASSRLEQELQRNNEEVSAKICSNFSDLFGSFKKKMDQALERTVNELVNTCHRAGQEISAACKESRSSIDTASSNIQREVDLSLSQMLQRVKQARKAAIGKVEQAATGVNSADTIKSLPKILDDIAVDTKAAVNAEAAAGIEAIANTETATGTDTIADAETAAGTEAIADAELWSDEAHGDEHE